MNLLLRIGMSRTEDEQNSHPPVCRHVVTEGGMRDNTILVIPYSAVGDRAFA